MRKGSEIMCEFCDDNSMSCEYFKNGDKWQHEVYGNHWDDYNDDFEKVISFDVKYCQYCGRELDSE